MRRHLLKITFICVLGLSAWTTASPVLAQQTTGSIEGRVLDENGSSLAFVRVTVRSPSLQGDRNTITTPEGRFFVFSLPAGVYTVTISHVSHHEVAIENTFVRLAKTTPLGDIRLTPRIIEMPGITVTAPRSLLDHDPTPIGANLLADQYETLPVDRNYRSTSTLLPHFNESYLGDEINIAGATGMENRYFIDGIDASDPFRGATGTNLPYNFVKEIEVRTGAYGAEYRSSLGGVLNVITYSGANEYHGRVFGFFSNDRLGGEPRRTQFQPASGDFSRYDFGFGLGGPLTRDRLWFYGAYSPAHEDEDVEVPGAGFFPDKSTAHIFAGKLTWKASDKTNVALTVFGDPSSREAVGETLSPWGTPAHFDNPDPYLANIESGGTNVSIAATTFLRDNVVIDPWVSVVTRRYKGGPATARGASEIFFLDAETGTWSGGYPERTDFRSLQSSAGVRATVVLDEHRIKTGFEYRDNALDADARFAALVRFSPVSYLDFLRVIDGTVHNRVPSFFVQDTWSVTERFRIGAGIRWDGQFLVGSNGKVAQRIADQYQPRIGVAYSIGNTGSQKIFGSYGRFYQELSTFLSTIYHMEEGGQQFVAYDHDPRVDPSGGVVVGGSSGIQPAVDALDGQYYDEFTLGYERVLSGDLKLGTRGVYRALGQGIEDGFVEGDGQFRYGNPGKYPLSAFPKMTREYRALELTLEKTNEGVFNFLASYVLSRNRGNYTGLFSSDYNFAWPNTNASFDYVENLVNATGLLPNDRTHVFKFACSYRWGFGLTVGTRFWWQSGTPLSVLGGSQAGPPFFNFIGERGSAGRTPSIWDLNLRFSYDLSAVMRSSVHQRFVVDLFHVGSERKPVNFDQIKYYGLDEDGNQTGANPFWGSPTTFQPPMAVRLGFEVDF